MSRETSGLAEMAYVIIIISPKNNIDISFASGGNSVDRDLLEESFELRKDKLHTWFYEETGALLDRLQDQVWPEMVFILTFLFLSKNGLHYH